MKKRPTGHYKKYSHFKGRDTAPTTSSREGSCIVDLSTPGERTLWLKLKSLAGGVRRMTKYFVQRCQSIYVYNLNYSLRVQEVTVSLRRVTREQWRT